MRARYFDPAIGRFISEDPDKHGINWFAYASNNPVNRFDFTGREDLPSITVGMEGVAIDGTVIPGLTELSVSGVQVDGTLMAEVNMISGQNIGFRTMYAAINGWAKWQGIQAIYISAIAGSAQGQQLLQKFASFVNAMGGNASYAPTDSPIQWIYWLIQ